VQATRLVGTRRPHATRPADVSWLHDPHARERNARLLDQTRNDLPEHSVHITFTGDPQRQILQSFKVHGGR